MSLRQSTRRAAWPVLGMPPPVKVRPVGGYLLSPGAGVIGDVAIGGHTTIGAACTIHGPVTIGRYCQLGPSTAVYGQNHAVNRVTTYVNARLFDGRLAEGNVLDPTTIGHDIWTGHGVVVLPGVSIHSGAVVGAGSVVTKDVSAYSIVAGNPARAIGERFDAEVQEALLRWAWWDLEPDGLRPFEPLFSLNLDDPAQRLEFLAARRDDRSAVQPSN